ncbi:MAG: hypothetical protein HY606_14500 [Planctomycetes bacterium]|nr:hypothetical protein [Planctomycetota bacterium]
MKFSTVFCVVIISLACTTNTPVYKVSIEELDEQYSRNIEVYTNYLNALSLFESQKQENWVVAKEIISSLKLRIPEEDKPYFEKALELSKDGESARKQLVDSSKIKRSSLVFSQSYDPESWKNAFQILIEFGEKGELVLAGTLIMLIGRQHTLSYWSEIRFYLLKIRNISVPMLNEYIDELIKKIPNKELYVVRDELIQSMACIVSSGKNGIKRICNIFESSSNIHVKKACLLAFGELQDPIKGLELIIASIRSNNDSLHEAAYYTLSKYSFYREKVSEILRASIINDADTSCRIQIINTIGMLKLSDCIDILISYMSHPIYKDYVAVSLKRVTGLTYETEKQWLQWYERKKKQ